MTPLPSHRPGTVVLTGATRGFGRHAALALIAAEPHHRYVLLARGDAQRQARELGASSPGADVSAIAVDLGRLGEVQDAARRIVDDVSGGALPPLVGYFGNAGLAMSRGDTTTADGYETTFAVNVLAHRLLAEQLLPAFSESGWMLLTSSDAHAGRFRDSLGLMPPPRWQAATRLAAPGGGDSRAGTRAYATSKLGTIYLAHALARRTPAGVTVMSYNPGLVTGTELMRDAPQPLRTLLSGFFAARRRLGDGMDPARAGAVLAATILERRAVESGDYVDRGRVVPSSQESYDISREEQLWTETGALIDTALGAHVIEHGRAGTLEG